MTHKVTKEQYQTAYKTSVDQSLKNMPNAGKNKTPKPQPSSSVTQTKGIVADMANETVIYICPLKCGFTSENFEILKVHCSAEHPNQISDSSSVQVTTTDLQQQQAHQNNHPNIHHIGSNQETSSSTFLNSSQNKNQTNQSNMISIKQEIASDTSIYQLAATPSTNQSTNQSGTQPSLEFKVQDKFTCPVPNCGFVSTKETEFKMHCVDHTVANDENIRYRCTANECKEVYNNVESFIKHLQSHDKANTCNTETEQTGSSESLRAKSRYLIFLLLRIYLN